MSVQNKELQLISVERNGYYDAGRIIDFGESPQQMKRRSSVSTKRRKRRQRQRKLLCEIGICIALFIGCGYVTNWFTKIPLFGKSVRIEQIQESGEYPKELVELLNKNEETYDFVKDYPDREKYKSEAIDISKDYKTGSVPLLMQWDKRWGYDMYGNAMIGLSGCGPTCMTMAYLYYTGDTAMNPKEMAEYAQTAGYHTDEGTSWNFWTDGVANLGLYGEEISLNEKIMEAVLDSGGLIVCSMAPGDFTDGGHYILLRGYDEKGFFVNDPNRKSNSKKQWTYDTLSTQIKNLWAIYGQ